MKGKGVATAEGHRGSAGHRRGGGTVQAVERRAQGAGSLPSRVGRGLAPRAPGGVSEMAERCRRIPSRLRDLGGRRAGRAAPADAADLRAQGPPRPRPHRRGQPALQRRRHRAAPSHPGADERGAEPRRRAEGARAGGGAGRGCAGSSTWRARAPTAAVERTHRQYRRDLVPAEPVRGASSASAAAALSSGASPGTTSPARGRGTPRWRRTGRRTPR